MKERPILFKDEMVRAILAGHKTQTRRIMNPQPSESFQPQIGEYHRTMTDPRDGEQFPSKELFWGASDENEDYPSPNGKIGDRLWVKETFCDVGINPAKEKAHAVLRFRADGKEGYVWKPSIFMKREYSRLPLEIVSVRVERLQEITRGDAMAEGCPFSNMADGPDPRQWYREMWESINGKGSWDKNPWVWVIGFRKV